MTARPATLRICPVSPSHACARAASERRLMLRRSILSLLASAPEQTEAV